MERGKEDTTYGRYCVRVVALVLLGAFVAVAVVMTGRYLDNRLLTAALLALALLQMGGLVVHWVLTRRGARQLADQLGQRLHGQLTQEDCQGLKTGHGAVAYGHVMGLLLEEMEHKYQKQLLHREAKLNVLQSQINPHFLYNTLDSIRSDVVEAGLKKPGEMLHELASFFRYSISEKRPIISLREEIKNVETYMNIMQYRFGSRVVLMKYVDHQDEALLEYQMPKMILQPLVENAIQHGLESRLGEGLIILHGSRTDQFVEITVQDNGVGMDAETLRQLRVAVLGKGESIPAKGEKMGGLALPNVDRRLKLRFGEQYGLSITSEEGIGTEIRILMPLSGGISEGTYD